MTHLRLEFGHAPSTRDAAPDGVLARHLVREPLLRRLLAESDATLSTLRGVTTPDAAVVLGPSAALPWVDGVVYLRRSTEAPSLLLPCTCNSSIPEALLAAALRRAHPTVRPPFVALPDTRTLIGLASALPLDRAHILAALETS